MPRKGGAAARPARPRSAPPQTTAAKNHAPPAMVTYQPPSVAGGIVGSVVQGAAFGTGSAVAHRAVDAVAGPRTIHHEHTSVTSSNQQQQPPRSMDDMCINAGKAFQECVNSNLNDIGKCQFLLDLLNQCRKNSSSAESGPSQQ